MKSSYLKWISHLVIALKMDGKLSVVEAVGDGIVKTLYSDFIKDKLNSQTTVAWIFPLSDAYRKKLKQLNFVFSFVDTNCKFGWESESGSCYDDIRILY